MTISVLSSRQGGILVDEAVDAYIAAKTASGGLLPATVQGYRSLAARASEYLSSIHVADLRGDDIVGMHDDMRSRHRAGEKGMSSSSAVKTADLVLAACAWAVSSGFAATCPALSVRPRFERRSPSSRILPERSRAAVDGLAATRPPTALSAAVSLIAGGGIPSCEVCALRWWDVDPDKRSAVARNRVTRAQGGGMSLCALESAVPYALSAAAVATLSAWRAVQMSRMSGFGCRWETGSFVLAEPGLGLPQPAALGIAWRKLARAGRIVCGDGSLATLADIRGCLALDGGAA